MADNAPMSFEDQLADFARLVEAARRLQGADTVPPAIAVDERGQPVVQVGPERVRQAVPDATGVVAGQYGLPPMPERAPPEMRSANTPLGDLVAQGTDSPLLGAFASKADRGAGAVTRTAGDLLIGQPVRAGEAVADFALDPSIPNAGNAAIQTGMALMKAKPIVAGLVGGYGAAAAQDMGLLGTEAQAQRAKTPPKAAEPPVVRPGLDEQQNAELSKLEKLSRDQNGWLSRPDTERLRELRTLSNTFTAEEARSKRKVQEDKEAAALKAEADKKAADLKAYTDATERADKNLEVAKQSAKERAASRNFSNTAVGQLYDKAGVVSPLLATTFLGAAAKVPRNAEPGLGTYLGGAGLGVMGANYPYLHNMIAQGQEPLNPEKVAYSDYARDLPPEHPRREEWKNYASSLPDENPVATQAHNAMWSPLALAERTGLGVIEGLSGVHGGKILMDAVKSGPTQAYQNARNEVKSGLDYLRGLRSTNTPPPSASQIPGQSLALPAPGSGSTPTSILPPSSAATVPSAATAMPASGPPSPLAGGGVMTMAPRPPQPPMPAPGPGANPSPLAAGGANQPTTSGILSSIKRVERDKPNPMLPSPAEAPAAAADELPKGMLRGADGVIYWEKGIYGGHKVDKPILEAMGLENKKRPTKAAKSSKADDGGIPEKPSVQMDDTRPLGSRRQREED